MMSDSWRFHSSALFNVADMVARTLVQTNAMGPFFVTQQLLKQGLIGPPGTLVVQISSIVASHGDLTVSSVSGGAWGRYAPVGGYEVGYGQWPMPLTYVTTVSSGESAHVSGRVRASLWVVGAQASRGLLVLTGGYAYRASKAALNVSGPL